MLLCRKQKLGKFIEPGRVTLAGIHRMSLRRCRLTRAEDEVVPSPRRTGEDQPPKKDSGQCQPCGRSGGGGFANRKRLRSGPQ